MFFFWGHAYELVTEDLWQMVEERVARISADPAAAWRFPGDLFPPDANQT